MVKHQLVLVYVDVQQQIEKEPQDIDPMTSEPFGMQFDICITTKVNKCLVTMYGYSIVTIECKRE